MTRGIEDRLKAAVQAKMQTVTVERLRPPQPPSDDDSPRLAARRHRPGRWAAPLLAAAAVIAVALGTTAAVTLADGHHRPANTPTPSPVPTIRPATPTTAPPTTTPSTSVTVESPTQPTSAPRSNAPATPPPGASHTIDVQFDQGAVGVTVPSDWVKSRTDPPACCGTPPTRCIVDGSADYAGDANACLLAITVGHLSPDYPHLAPTCRHWQTTAESNAPIQDRIAEYRQFTDPCSGAVYEQWTIMSSPMIAFWHPVTARSTTALVEQIVDSAKLPAEVDARRQLDEGILRALTMHADGYHVTIDRVVVNLDGSITNVNHATYEYRLSGSLTLTGDSPCRDCTNVDQVYQQYRKGPHPADGSKPVDGAFITLTSNFAPNVDDGYELDLSPARPFHS